MNFKKLFNKEGKCYAHNLNYCAQCNKSAKRRKFFVYGVFIVLAILFVYGWFMTVKEKNKEQDTNFINNKIKFSNIADSFDCNTLKVYADCLTNGNYINGLNLDEGFLKGCLGENPKTYNINRILYDLKIKC